ncbi:MAG: TlpA family protein disulfide reductase [Prevotella sp.]|nr:TlpA family protein disulfide reductase [Prevotella sp.]
MTPCLTQAKVTITGITGEYVNKEMSLFECHDGIPLLLTTTEVDSNGAFSLSTEIPETGFYLLGYKGGVRHVLYLKGKETLKVRFTNYDLSILQGAGVECQLLSDWEKEAAKVRAHAWFFRSTGGCESVEASVFNKEMASLKTLSARLSQRLKGLRAAANDFAPLMQLKMDTDMAFMRLAYHRTHLGETDESFISDVDWQYADQLFQKPKLLQLPLIPEMMGVYVDCKAARQLAPIENPTIISGSEYKARANLIADKGLRQSYVYDIASRLRYYEMYRQLYDTFVDEPFSERMLQALKPIEHSLDWSKPGNDAPDFKGIKTNDEWLSLSDFRGKVVVIDVWATWCVPCLQMMPYFRQLEKELSEPDLAFLSVCVGAIPEKDLWLKLVKEKQLSGNIIFIDNWTRGFAKDYRVSSVPRFMIIDRQGKVFSYAAPSPKYPQLKQLILQALGAE